MFSREINKQLYCPKCFTSSSRQKRYSLKFICRRLEFRCRNKIEREKRLPPTTAHNNKTGPILLNQQQRAHTYTPGLNVRRVI
jgi:hypothetical protein